MQRKPPKGRSQLTAAERQALLAAALAKPKVWNKPEDKWRDPANWRAPLFQQRQRQPGGGRKPSLAAADIARGKAKLRRKLKEPLPLRSKKALAEYKELRTLKGAANYVRRFLPEAKRDVGTDTLIARIVRPVLAPAEK